MNKIRIGIVGAGSISRYHADAYKLLENVEIMAVCDINRQRAEDFAKKYDVKNIFTDYNEMFKVGNLDAISVTTWNNAHEPVTIAALEAGYSVLCEKPLAMNTEQAKLMVETAQKTGKLLMVGFVRRFGENTKVLKNFIDDKMLGKVYYTKVSCVRRWGNPGGWFSDKKRSGGGPVIDLGVHILDLARYLAGKPKAISVFASTFNQIGMMPQIKGVDKYYSADYSEYCDVEDGATAIVKFENGMTLFFEVSWVLNLKEDRLYVQLFGDKAGAQLEPTLEIYGSKGKYLTDFKPILSPETDSFAHNFNEEIKHFVDCVRNSSECINPAEDGLEIMKIIDAIYKSSATGHEVIIR